jgi:hypothetical protein
MAEGSINEEHQRQDKKSAKQLSMTFQNMRSADLKWVFSIPPYLLCKKEQLIAGAQA